jgi:hypothetical protein
MGKIVFAWDGCKAEYSMGQKRPRRCEHGALFMTEAELSPPPRKPLARVSKQRQAEEESGARPRRRRSTLKQGRGFATAPAQREKVKGLVCVGCGQEASEWTVIDPAHLWPKGKGGCNHPDCVIPLCRHSHEDGEAGCHWVEMAHPISEHQVSPFTLTERLTATSNIPLPTHNERNQQ